MIKQKLNFIIKPLLLLIALYSIIPIFAQVTIGSGKEPVKGALLQLKDKEPTSTSNVTSTTGGLALPRVELVDVTTLQPFIKTTDTEWQTANQAETKRKHTGLTVFNIKENTTFQKGIYVWDGNKWTLAGANVNNPTTDSWLKTGNAGTTAATNFVGTTDNVPLSLRTNNTNRMHFTTSGTIGIGTTSPNASAILDINATNKGILIPRVELTGKKDQATIPSPAEGLMVYNTKNANSGVDAVMGKTFYVWKDATTGWDPLVSETVINTLRIPEPVIYELTTSQYNFLDGVGIGNSRPLPISEIINSIPDKISQNGSVLTFKPGVYQITVVYEGAAPSGDCTLSSYFVDFPNAKRIHSTASHNKGGTSNHGGTITYTFKTSTTRNWTVALGRGQSGDCMNGLSLYAGSTQVLILRLGDV